MVTRGDAEWSIYQGLRSLPRRPYLVAMWIVCGELRTLYAPWNNDEKLLELMAATTPATTRATCPSRGGSRTCPPASSSWPATRA